MPLTPQQTHDEIMFWLGLQDRDHVAFSSLGIEDPALRAQAQRLLEAYDDAWRRQDPNALLALAAPSQQYKQQLLDAIDHRWIGWLFKSFIEHTKMEIDMFLKRIGPGLSSRDELCFYTLMAQQHAQFAAHLLDIDQYPLINEANRQAGQLMGLHNACMRDTMQTMVVLSDRYGRELDGYFNTAKAARPPPSSVISPALLDHVLREGQRFLGTVHAIGALGPAAGA